MAFLDLAHAQAKLEAHFLARTDGARRCALGSIALLYGDISPQRPSLYILGFNGGETQPGVDSRETRSTKRWFAVCARAAEAVGVSGYIIGERSHWGSPNVGELRKRVGSEAAFRDMLRFHAKINQQLFATLPPLLIWAPGVSTCVQEAIEDYGLTEQQTFRLENSSRTETIWRHFIGSDGVPFLFTRHPTGARLSKCQRKIIFEKLAELGRARTETLALPPHTASGATS
jgi:hypothetical protein